jgi:hypothetical protein
MEDWMNALKRTTLALAAASIAVVPAVRAQITGMPLFTNPRYATGIRVHGDFGRPSGDAVIPGVDQTVYEVGLGFVLGPLGIDANVGAQRSAISSIQTCTNAGVPTSGCDPRTKASASALAQLRFAGGGQSPWSLSAFGGASMDVSAYGVGSLTAAQAAAIGIDTTKTLAIPVGLALGYKIPLGLASLNLWAAPRFTFMKAMSCGTACPATTNMFRWAVGADIPVFKLFSVRAAYDSGSKNSVTTSYWGLGASFGFGGMR